LRLFIGRCVLAAPFPNSTAGLLARGFGPGDFAAAAAELELVAATDAAHFFEPYSLRNWFLARIDYQTQRPIEKSLRRSETGNFSMKGLP
jgi:hypothetical protein